MESVWTWAIFDRENKLKRSGICHSPESFKDTMADNANNGNVGDRFVWCRLTPRGDTGARLAVKGADIKL